MSRGHYRSRSDGRSAAGASGVGSTIDEPRCFVEVVFAGFVDHAKQSASPCTLVIDDNVCPSRFQRSLVARIVDAEHRASATIYHGGASFDSCLSENLTPSNAACFTAI